LLEANANLLNWHHRRDKLSLFSLLSLLLRTTQFDPRSAASAR